MSPPQSPGRFSRGSYSEHPSRLGLRNATGDARGRRAGGRSGTGRGSTRTRPSAALLAEGARPRELADALAELKARRVGEAHPEGLTLGADQVLEFDGAVLGKPATPEDAGRC